MDADTATSKKKVIVLGAGVIGLTTALKLQETGRYQVEIVAEILPTDPKNIKYTSQWAGAHFVSISPSGTPQADIDHATFLEFWRLSAPGGDAEECFLRLHQTEYYISENPYSDALRRMPSYQEITQPDLFHRAKCGYSFETVTIDVPQYLNYLFSRFLSKGGRVTRAHVQHISQVLEAGAVPFQDTSSTRRNEALEAPDAVVVCVGLGAKALGGVEDADVYPVRGQTVILRAPWVRFGRTFEGENEWTYIIPRKSGDVIVGGTQGPNDWYPKPRREITEDILRRGLELCPELVPPAVRASKESPTIEDLEPIIIEEACGLRPMRKGGLRIEVAPSVTAASGKKVTVIYNYGHGARGYIASVGSADVAIGLLEGEFRAQ
ncbi:nucleotide-binding domain-containing protein [Pholiota conissans]|uniref:Nucleotide-binding domain-containing protein n=1 Tax=Pholiota conissans TaxID=109636 RepID=A0A9P6D746_9AGAR|nr:nucleotide-binding domain-containing protein [Pholiota conissans]